MELTYHNTRQRITTSNVLQIPDPSLPTIIANGTVLSIIEWSQQASLAMDTEQPLAFQIITATFVLTYYNDAKANDPSMSA